MPELSTLSYSVDGKDASIVLSNRLFVAPGEELTAEQINRLIADLVTVKESITHHDYDHYDKLIEKGFTDHQANWLVSLLSGRYRQAKGKLHTSDGGHCCLGVAALVCKLDVAAHESVLTGDSYKQLKLRGQGGSFYRPLWDKDGALRTGLTALNDEGGWTFAEIAQFCIDFPWVVFTNFPVPEEFDTGSDGSGVHFSDLRDWIASHAPSGETPGLEG